jgi:hypothetical protein
MADTTLNLDVASITAALRKNLAGYSPATETAAVGRILEVGDGIARVSGLPGAAVNELLEFEGGTIGLALNLDEDSIGAVVLGEVGDIEEGQTVRATGNILNVAVGDALLGRVVDALGNPIDGLGPLGTSETRRLEVQAPGIMGRKPVHEPLQTGIKAIDAMVPIGRGQRELIIGDRKTGKSTVAVDAIINQRGLGVNCIYVAIGQKASTVAQTVETLRAFGRLEYTVVVVAPASDPAPFKYLAPLRRLRHGPALDGQRQARPRRVRRPVQAGRGVPPDLAAAPPPAGPRGVPGRRLLPPQPPARACRQAERRPRRRLAHRPARHRDQGRRHLRLHPDQRDLHHRRQIFLQDDLFKSGCARRSTSASRCPGGLRRPDQGHEDGHRHDEGRPRPVPRARGVRRLRLRARQGVPGPARPGLPPHRAAQAAAQLAHAGRAPGHLALRRHPRRPRPDPRRRRAPLRGRAARVGRHPPRRDGRGIRTSGRIGDTAALDAAIAAFGEQFTPSSGAGADEPDPEDFGDASQRAAGGSSEGILPEVEISREDGTV